MRPYYCLPFIDSSGRSWLWCTPSECRLQELLEPQAPVLPFTSDRQFQICPRPLQWGTIVQWKVHPPKGRYHAGHRLVKMDCSSVLASKSRGKRYQRHWKENWIWQTCSFLFFFCLCQVLLLKGSPRPLVNKARKLNFLLGLKARYHGLSWFANGIIKPLLLYSYSVIWSIAWKCSRAIYGKM